jgi:hypothetical protein
MRGGQWSRSFCSLHLEVFGGRHPVREGSRAGNLQTVGWLNRSVDGLTYASTLWFIDVWEVTARIWSKNGPLPAPWCCGER